MGETHTIQQIQAMDTKSTIVVDISAPAKV